MTELKFNQKRDFSSVINAAFEFYKQEGVLFAKTMISYTGIPIVLMISMLVYMVMQAVNGQFANVVNAPDFSSLANLFVPLFLLIVLGIIVQIMVVAASYGYIKVYHEKGKGNFSMSDVGSQITRNFFPIIGYTFVISILIMAGFVFFFLPGIYFAIILSLIYPIMFIEDKGLGKNFNRCFQVIRNNWWATFGVLLVASILVGIVGSIISVPLQFYVQFKIPMIAQSGDWGSLNLPFVIITYSLLIVLSIYLRSFVYVVTGLQYFSLNENEGSSTIMDRINQIGTENTSETTKL
ncbi:hypothetical protein [Carboxylicivirga sp. M1479]|uniref:hypothetical protein n=1 Tax=Carboxylicivirga sp. M1479 TaxID=2594476 RepID=UPI0011775BAC|nr:hypothetical protein [Carboxylicivirga sp. M1479]TRX72213.1 hypothetical protein FNN09_02245 [Carboxylicivirga sp. M1479]